MFFSSHCVARLYTAAIICVGLLLISQPTPRKPGGLIPIHSRHVPTRPPRVVETERAILCTSATGGRSTVAFCAALRLRLAQCRSHVKIGVTPGQTSRQIWPCRFLGSFHSSGLVLLGPTHSSYPSHAQRQRPLKLNGIY